MPKIAIREIAEPCRPIIGRILGALRRLRMLRLMPKTTRLLLLKRRYGDKYHEAIFSKIWEDNSWGDVESKSGSGSNLSQTAFIRDELPKLLGDLDVRRLLDIPCGDFRWMQEVHLSAGLEYFGGDIVDKMIKYNSDHYGNNTLSFLRLDILRDALPRVDLVLCRDCFVHFSISDICQAIRNLKRSGSTYLLVTHFTGDRQNRDIITGQWRPISLTRPPFNFPRPLRVIDERCTEAKGRYQDKCLALWRLEDLPDLS